MPRPKGATYHTNDRTRSARDIAWQTMRMLPNFDLPKLISVSPGLRQSNATAYVRGLLDAGYLRIIQTKRQGKKGGHAVYRLIRDTGPTAPRLRSDGFVYDINTDTVHQPVGAR